MKPFKIELWEIARVKPYELNAKIHDDKQVEKIAKSITEFGWDQPIVVDKDGVVIKGHGRRLAAIKLGLASVPVLVRSDLDEEQVRAARLADNRVAVSDIDADILKKELESLSFDLEGIFDAKELDFATADLLTVNEDVFAGNLEGVMSDTQAKTDDKIEASAAKRVALSKVLGFKDIAGGDVVFLTRFMAQLESERSEGDAAARFVGFIKELVSLSHA